MEKFQNYCWFNVGRWELCIYRSSDFRFWRWWISGNKHFTKNIERKENHPNGSNLVSKVRLIFEITKIQCNFGVQNLSKQRPLEKKKTPITGEKEKEMELGEIQHAWQLDKKPFKSTVCMLNVSTYVYRISVSRRLLYTRISSRIYMYARYNTIYVVATHSNNWY